MAKVANSNKWLGTMQGVKPKDPTRFEVVPEARVVGRRPFGWFAVTQFTEANGQLAIRMNADQQLRTTANQHFKPCAKCSTR